MRRDRVRDVREGDMKRWPKIEKLGEGIDLIGRQEWVEYYEQWQHLAIKKIIRKPEYDLMMRCKDER